MKPEALISAFVLHQSEDAFRELVASTVDEVYSRALRIVQGPPHLVEEAVLRVYWELARKAAGLGEDVAIAAWLREHTCKAALEVLHAEDRPVDRAALKREKQGLLGPSGRQAAPPGLATRVSQSILLNTARGQSFRLFPRGLWPAWIRPRHLGAGAVCLLGIIVFIVLSNIPFHSRNPIVQYQEELQMTPASFGQLANAEEGGASPPSSHTPNANAESSRNQQ